MSSTYRSHILNPIANPIHHLLRNRHDVRLLHPDSGWIVM